MLCLIGGRSTREDPGEFRVPKASDTSGSDSTENYELDLQDWIRHQYLPSEC